jgi:PelA/Pel-15E family pectate lyase
MSVFLRSALYLLVVVGLVIISVANASAHHDPSSMAFGWASYDASGTTNGTSGGYGADANHHYVVSNRNELIKALYPDAVIADDGSFSSQAGPDDTPKIIFVNGCIDLSSNKAGEPLGYDDFKDPEYDFEQYVETYKPIVWNIDPANWDTVKNRPLPVSGPLEDARVRSMENQGRIVSIAVGSNTSIFGLKKHALIKNGQLQIKDVGNVIVRNITFEDAFDHFPQWDPKDSYKLDTAIPGCQQTYVDENTGPHMCHGGRWNSEYDNVQVFNSTHVWIDHCSFSDGVNEDYLFASVFAPPHVGYDYIIQHHDGAVDVTGASNFVTISYNHFKNHDKTHLLGSSNTVSASKGWGALNITVAYNHYENAGQRLPRVRFGKVHVFNNYYTGRIGYLGAYAPTDDTLIPPNRFLYGIGIGHLAKLYVENNVFEIEDAPTEGTGDEVDASVMFYVWHKDDQEVDGVLERTYFYDTGTLLNGQSASILDAAQQASSEMGKAELASTDTIWTPGDNYQYRLLPSSKVKRYVLKNAGAGKRYMRWRKPRFLKPPSKRKTIAAMKKATDFMMDKVSYRKSGAFLWSYLPDLSRAWGEMEGYRSMAWMQKPGTSTVGHMLLDAYHATDHPYFFKQAAKVASTVISAQKDVGGWHFMHDFAGEESLRKWYDTIGKNGWRLEEFIHYWENATFDDSVTTEAASLLLRMYLEKKEDVYLAPLVKSIKFILDAQYDNGGWPQRHPEIEPFSYKDKPDYTRYITLNDNVAQENIQFLVSCYQTLSDADVGSDLREDMLASIYKAMDIFLDLQGPASQPAFALQYTLDLDPIGARTYEPDAYTTHTTAAAVSNLLVFYQITADEKYLERIDEALDWLDSVQLPDDYPYKPADRTHATFMEIGTDVPRFVHRTGSNITNGSYYWDYDPAKVIVHYNIWRAIDTDALRDRKAALMAIPKEALLAASPLHAEGISLPLFYSFSDIEVYELNTGNGLPETPVTAKEVAETIYELNRQGYWPAQLREVSNPYVGDGPVDPTPGDYSETRVGDMWDTSPYPPPSATMGISTRSYIENMGILMRWIFQ